jgi:ABC-type multidrug transport system fused ATPase/permease subunit
LRTESVSGKQDFLELLYLTPPLETIIDFDLILVMEDGVLAESGSPASLLSRPESKFAQLASSQGLSW